MPNLINRRKKKNKVPETVINDKSDSDSSDYDFSSKLNSKYNVLPEEFDKSKKTAGVKEEDSLSIRFVEFCGISFVIKIVERRR
jgi:hypothetical protein